MSTNHKKLLALLIGLITLTGVLPVILYWLIIDRGPTITVQESLGLLPFRESPQYQQWAAVMAAFVIKPIYMLLSLLLIIFLWRQKSSDLTALRWGLTAFLAGETFCSVNYLFFNEQSLLMEYFHSYGMVLSIGFIIFALIEGVDHRIVKYTDPKARCTWLALCQACAKYKDVPCGLNRLFKLISPTLIVLAVMPLNAVPQLVSYNTEILSTLYNYTHAGIHQLYEIRYCPTMAIVLFTISFLVLPRQQAGDVLLSKIFLAAGVGHLGFSFFRLGLLSFYTDNMVWFVFWEEATELIFVTSIGFVLWIFRDGLLKGKKVIAPWG